MNSGFLAKPMSSIIRSTMSDAAKDVEEVIAEGSDEQKQEAADLMEKLD